MKTMRDKIKAWLRSFLGMDEAFASFEKIMTLAKLQELRQKERGDRIMEKLNAIEQRMIPMQLDRPRMVETTLDWDTVQAIALSYLEKNPQKEDA